MERTNFRQAPETAVVERLFEQARPELVRLFQRHWVSEEEAGELLDEVLFRLLLRWRYLEDPLLWLVQSMERTIVCRLLLPLFCEEEPA